MKQFTRYENIIIKQNLLIINIFSVNSIVNKYTTKFILILYKLIIERVVRNEESKPSGRKVGGLKSLATSNRQDIEQSSIAFIVTNFCTDHL